MYVHTLIGKNIFVCEKKHMDEMTWNMNFNYNIFMAINIICRQMEDYYS